MKTTYLQRHTQPLRLNVALVALLLIYGLRIYVISRPEPVEQEEGQGANHGKTAPDGGGPSIVTATKPGEKLSSLDVVGSHKIHQGWRGRKSLHHLTLLLLRAGWLTGQRQDLVPRGMMGLKTDRGLLLPLLTAIATTGVGGRRGHVHAAVRRRRVSTSGSALEPGWCSHDQEPS